MKVEQIPRRALPALVVIGAGIVVSKIAVNVALRTLLYVSKRLSR